MKVKKIILRDNCDSQFDDLIIFNNYVLITDIENAINNVKKNIEDYTNEDIYKELDKLGINTIEYIGNYPIIEY